MCISCYEAYGSPTIITPDTIAMGKRLASANGFGALHIVVEDMNLEDEHIAFCRLPENNPTAEEITLVDDLLKQTIDERVSSYALGEGWISP